MNWKTVSTTITIDCKDKVEKKAVSDYIRQWQKNYYKNINKALKERILGD